SGSAASRARRSTAGISAASPTGSSTTRAGSAPPTSSTPGWRESRTWTSCPASPGIARAATGSSAIRPASSPSSPEEDPMHRLLLLGSILLLGCGSEPRLENRPPKVARVEVEAEAQELFRGQRVRWIARAWDDRGGSIPEPPVRWSSTAPEIVTVDGTGELLALSVGTARIEAEIGGK